LICVPRSATVKIEPGIDLQPSRIPHHFYIFFSLKLVKLAINNNVFTVNVVLKIYLVYSCLQASSVDMIWYDRGSGANRDFSCWRPKGPAGTYSLGDMPQSNYKRPHGLVARELEEGALTPPRYYRQRWNDRGSGANWDGAFWEPICPNGYVALGHVCTRNYNQPCEWLN
jgi:hypothetical protein